MAEGLRDSGNSGNRGGSSDRVVEDLSVSDLVNFVFCPRRAWLEAQGATVESADRVLGSRAHRTVDGGPAGRERIEVAHRGLGLVGRPDIVRDTDGTVQVIDYKNTARSRVVRVHSGELVQLAAYRACLEDMGYTVSRQALWLVRQRRMVHVTDAELAGVDLAETTARTREVFRSPNSPPALVDDPRCFGCSQLSVCQPSEQLISDPMLVPPIPNGRVIYLDHTVSFSRMKHGRMVLETAGGDGSPPESVPLEQILGVVVFGNTTLSTPLLNWLGEHGRTVVMCSYSGRVSGWFSGTYSRNSALRQELVLMPSERRYAVMTDILRAKMSSQAALAGKSDLGRGAASRIRDRAEKLPETADGDTGHDPLSTLFGVEGECSRAYLNWYLTDLPGWSIRGDGFRSRRPAHDPVNAALNYGYVLLQGAVTRAVLSCGMDPGSGLLHTPSRNKPALVLDLMEQFRVPLVDQIIRRMINTAMLCPNDFEKSGAAVSVTALARKKLITEFEKKMSSTHRYLDRDRELSWVRTVDHQVRQLLKILDGTQVQYRAIRVW